ncbi:MAG: hypothetical protein U0821_08665 [Chloroflexota bacterium]
MPEPEPHQGRRVPVLSFERPLYFAHVPKSAGTSLVSLLDQLVPEADIYPPQTHEQLAAFTQPVGRSYRLFRGHFGHGGGLPQARDAARVTLVRTPEEHVLSAFEHIRRNREHPVHHVARDVTSLVEAVKDDTLRSYLWNMQTQFFAVDLDVQGVAWTVNGGEFGLGPFGLPDGPPHPLEAELLAIAKTRLRSYLAVGVTERFDDFLRLLRQLLGQPLELRAPRLNVTTGRLSVDALLPEERACLESITRLDRELYAFALGLFNCALEGSGLQHSTNDPIPPDPGPPARSRELWQLSHLSALRGVIADLEAAMQQTALQAADQNALIAHQQRHIAWQEQHIAWQQQHIEWQEEHIAWQQQHIVCQGDRISQLESAGNDKRGPSESPAGRGSSERARPPKASRTDSP